MVKKLTFERVGAAESWAAAAADDAHEDDAAVGECRADVYGREAADAWYSAPVWGWLPVRRVIH